MSPTNTGENHIRLSLQGCFCADNAQSVRRWCSQILVLLVSIGLVSACTARPVVEPFASGLNQPRGLAIDDSGNLLVAEAGALKPG
jgi:hypothetical protein